MVPSLIHKIREQWKNLRQQIPPPYRPYVNPALGVLSLLLLGSLFFAIRPSPAHWALLLDGEVVGWVEDRQELEEALHRLQEEKKSSYGPGIELTFRTLSRANN